MSGAGWMWRRRWVVWLPPLLFFVLNLALFFADRLVLAVRVAASEATLAAHQDQLADLAGERQRLEDLLARGEQTREAIDWLYGEQFATESERLTLAITAVKGLARRSGFEPESLSYPEQPIKDFGLVKKSITFNVVCTYEQLRQFVALLETSAQFLTLEQISMSEGGELGSKLSINLQISTVFVVPEAAARRSRS